MTKKLRSDYFKIDPKYEKLVNSHIKEADRKRAEITNMGWATGDNFIHSKTTKGRLYSERNKKGRTEHSWGDEEYAESRGITGKDQVS
jgi:hypothetical protein